MTSLATPAAQQFDLATWTAALQKIPEAQYQAALQAMFAEKDRRAALPLIQARAAELEAAQGVERAATVAALKDKLPAPPSGTRPWKAWSAADRATWFFYGDKVTAGGKTWESKVDPAGKQPNVWEPGATGIDERYWVEVATTTTPPTGSLAAWSGNSVSYKVGDLVTYQCATFKVLQAHVSQSGWTPDDVASLYTKQ